ncbi:hypothetical protein OIU76_029688 [Salix suchowensis]|nr:hypothetical protein OIU76_029688 [Salix suchowensis]
MLFATIRDMEHLIEGLKSKVSKAESREESAEDKCIILSETNADLNEELSFLRGRLKYLEASLNQAEETKMATAKDIGFQTKVITDLVMRLAIERERLHKQWNNGLLKNLNHPQKIALLALQNQTLVVKLQQTGKDAFGDIKYHNKGSGEDLAKFSATISEVDKAQKSGPVSETEVAHADSISELESPQKLLLW